MLAGGASVGQAGGFDVAVADQGDEGGVGVFGHRAGDVDADGKNDYLVGDRGASPGGRASARAAYALKGQASGWSASYDVSTLAGNGYEFDGAAAGDKAGTWVTTGDLNHDGKADLVIAAPGHSPSGVSGGGSVYVLWGKTGGWSNPQNLGTLAP